MIRRRINQGTIKGKRFQVSDVPDISTPQGAAKENDEMRKLAMDLTSFAKEVDGKIDDVKAAIPVPPKTTTTTGGGTSTPVKAPDIKLPILEVWQDGNAVVVGTRIWDFQQSPSVKFEVKDLGNQRARIRAHVTRTLNTMWGTFNGGYALEVPATPGGNINHPGYYSKYSVSQPFVVQTDRSLIHWVGDTMSREPVYEAGLNPSGTPRTGFNADKPTHEFSAWTAYTQGVTVASGTSYDVTTVKGRVTPNLTIYDPDETHQTTQYVTRIFFKDSDTIKPHVRVDDSVFISSGITDPRTYSAKIWLDIDDHAFGIENLGASGTNIGEVYKEQIDRTFYLRRLRTVGGIYLTEDSEYITISGSPGGSSVIDRFYNLPLDNTIPRLEVYAYTVVSGGYYDHYLRGLYGAGNVTLYYDVNDRIMISGEDNTFVDNCLSAVGTGEIFHELDTTGNTRTFYLRKLLAGSGIEITTEMHDVVIRNTASGIMYAIDNCQESSGEGEVYHDYTLSNNTQTFHLRKIQAGSGITVETVGHSIVITASGAPVYNYSIDNCEQGTGTGLVYHDLSASGTGATFHLRKILAGSGIEVETVDHDIIIKSTASGIDWVEGENTSGDCQTTGYSNEWYLGYEDDIDTHTRKLKFRKFGVLNDLRLVNCGDGYGFSLGYIFDNGTTEGKGIWFDKTETASGVYTVKFRGIRAGAGISVDYLNDDPNQGDRDIVISVSGIGINTITKVDNVGIGAKVMRDYTVSGNETTYHLRSIISDDQNYLYAAESDNEIRIGLYHDPEWIGIEDACQTASGSFLPDYGPHSLIDYVSGTGAYPYWPYRKMYGLKKISGQGYIQVHETDCELKISLSGISTPDVSGKNIGAGTGDLVYDVYDSVSGTDPKYLQFQRLQRFDYSNGVGIYIQETDNTLLFSTRNQNWTTSQGSSVTEPVEFLFYDPATNAYGRNAVVTNLAGQVWHGLYFPAINIYEQYNGPSKIYEPKRRTGTNEVGVYKEPSNIVPAWYFKPQDVANNKTISDYSNNGEWKNNLVFLVSVRIHLTGGNAIGQGLNSGIEYPQLALFRNNIFWRTLDVDLRIKDFNDLRDTLANLNNVVIPQSFPKANKIWLHGTALVQLNDTDILEVKYRHNSINSVGSGDIYNRRYHQLVEGSVDITRVGLHDIGQQANTPRINYATSGFDT